MKSTYKINGMDCASCATMLEVDLENVGIPCKCDYAKSVLEIEGKHDSKKVIEIVNNAGYSIT